MNYDLESIVIKIDTDASGNLKIPVAGCNENFAQNFPYDWQVSYDDGEFVRYQGTGGAKAITIGTGLGAGTNHTVVIKPTTEAYGWAKAFGFLESGVANLLTEIIWDKTYMGYALSATNTGAGFRIAQYYLCPRITYVPEEYMPDTVTTVGNCFRYCQYQASSGITTLTPEVLSNQVVTIGTYFRSCQYSGEGDITMSIMDVVDEVMPDTVTTIGDYFREDIYWNCPNITRAAKEKLSTNLTTIGNKFRKDMYLYCSNLKTPSKEDLPNSVTSIGNYFRREQYYGCTALTKPAEEVLSNSVTTIGDYFRYYQYGNCVSLLNAAGEVLPNSIITIGNYFRYYQYGSCDSLKTPAVEYLPDSVITIGNYFRTNQYRSCDSLKTPAVEYLPDSVTTIGDYYRGYMYTYSGVTKTAVEYVPPHLTSVGGYYRYCQYHACDVLAEVTKEADLPGVTVGDRFRASQYRSCPSITKAKLAAFTGTFLGNNRYLIFTDSLSTNTPITITIIGHAFEKPQASLGITNDAVVDKIYVDSNFLQQYKSSSNWSAISDDKFVGISTASVTAGILVGYKPDSNINADRQLILNGSIFESCPRRVLTGTENWVWDNANNRVYMAITQGTTSWYGASSTHGPCKESSSDTTRDDGRCTDNKKLCCYTTKNSLQEFKDWLAQEYADGTPVIVINNNGTFNTITGEPQDINVMDGENIIEVISTAASKPEDIKLEATVGLDTGNYSAYVLSDVDYTDINNWIKVSETKDTEGFITRGELSNVALSGDYEDLENTPDLTQYVDKESNETITGKKNFTGGITVTSPITSTDAATKGYVDDGLNDKQDTLTAGTGIDITNNAVSKKIFYVEVYASQIGLPDTTYADTAQAYQQGYELIRRYNGTSSINTYELTYVSDSGAPSNPYTFYFSSDTPGKWYKFTPSGWSTVSAGGGDMQYSDFEFTQPTGNTITLSLSTEITPSANFTVNAPSTIKEGQAYVLRVTNGATPVTMALGTGIVNPSQVDLTLTANAIDQFAFLGLSDGTLELQPGGSGDSLPDQTGNAGKFLQTNGAEASWNNPNEILTQAEYDLLTPVNGITYFIYEVEN